MRGRGQVTILVLVVAFLLFVMVAVFSPVLSQFIGVAQTGADTGTQLVWSLVLPIFIIACIGFLVHFISPEKAL